MLVVNNDRIYVLSSSGAWMLSFALKWAENLGNVRHSVYKSINAGYFENIKRVIA